MGREKLKATCKLLLMASRYGHETFLRRSVHFIMLLFSINYDSVTLERAEALPVF